MIAVALSTLRREFSVDVATVTWVITVFYLASAVLQPLMGRLADRYGAHRVFTFGMAVVAVAGAGGAFAPSLEWVCVARVVLAVGTAAAFPSAAALLRSLAPRGGFDAAKVIARIQLIDTSTAAVGPVVGGALILVAGWQAVFWINVPLAVLAIAATRLLIPRDGHRDPVPLRRTLSESDIPGLLAFAATVTAMLMFLLGLRDGAEWPLLVAAIAAGALFAWRELTASIPFVDLRLLAAHLPLVRVYGLFVIANIVLYGTLFGIPQYLEDFASYSTAIVGAMLVPLAAFNAVLARPIERLIDRWGVRATMLTGAIGLVVATAALPVLALSTHWWIVLLLMAAVGIPYAFVLISLTQSLYRTAPPEIVGQAAGLFQTARSLGCISAAAVVGLSFSGAVAADDWIVLSVAVTIAALVLTVATAATGRASARVA